MSTPSRLTTHVLRSIQSLALGLPLGLAVLASVGCASATVEPRGAASAGERPDLVSGGVEVWSEHEPARELVETGELAARTASRAETVAKLQREARRLYMSGLYKLECSGPGGGACSAVGFVYRDDPSASDEVELAGASARSSVRAITGRE